MYVRLVHLWGARAKHVVIIRIPSSLLPRRVAYFSDGTHPATALGLHYGQGKQCWHS